MYVLRCKCTSANYIKLTHASLIWLHYMLSQHTCGYDTTYICVNRCGYDTTYVL